VQLRLISLYSSATNFIMPDMSCSLDIEITAYFATKSLDEFLDLQQVRVVTHCVKKYNRRPGCFVVPSVVTLCVSLTVTLAVLLLCRWLI
jgi:hypothetical protein